MSEGHDTFSGHRQPGKQLQCVVQQSTVMRHLLGIAKHFEVRHTTSAQGIPHTTLLPKKGERQLLFQ